MVDMFGQTFSFSIQIHIKRINQGGLERSCTKEIPTLSSAVEKEKNEAQNENDLLY